MPEFSGDRHRPRLAGDETELTEPTAPVSLGSLLAVAGFAAFCLAFHLFSTDGWVPLLDSANLVLHEAGHPLVGMLSQRATVYGGTLFQLAFPLAAAWHFRHAGNSAGNSVGNSAGNPAGLAASLVWLGENLFNVARYMADARAQELPLVGNGDHNWTEIFSRWNILPLDGRIAGFTRFAGALLIAWALIGLYRAWREQRSSP